MQKQKTHTKMDEEDNIEIHGYTDQRMGVGIKRQGFQSRFKALKKTERILCYLPIKGKKTTKEEWEAFYLRNRSGRNIGERGTKVKLYGYYQFLKKEPKNKNSKLYYYSIPRGFTQTDLMNVEADYSTMISITNNTYRFRVESRISKKVGLCILERI